VTDKPRDKADKSHLGLVLLAGVAAAVGTVVVVQAMKPKPPEQVEGTLQGWAISIMVP